MPPFLSCVINTSHYAPARCGSRQTNRLHMESMSVSRMDVKMLLDRLMHIFYIALHISKADLGCLLTKGWQLQELLCRLHIYQFWCHCWECSCRGLSETLKDAFSSRTTPRHVTFLFSQEFWRQITCIHLSFTRARLSLIRSSPFCLILSSCCHWPWKLQLPNVAKSHIISEHSTPTCKESKSSWIAASAFSV